MSPNLFDVFIGAVLTGGPILAYIAWRKAPAERESVAVETMEKVNDELRKQIEARDAEISRLQQLREAQQREAQEKIEALQERVAALEAMYEELVRRTAQQGA